MLGPPFDFVIINLAILELIRLFPLALSQASPLGSLEVSNTSDLFRPTNLDPFVHLITTKLAELGKDLMGNLFSGLAFDA